jgi:rhamnose transport system substrate-binding protein
VRIATFNVNGVVRRLANLLDWLAETRPDVVCLQELKAAEPDFPAAALARAGYGAVWRGQRSWNGVAILARDAEPVLTRTQLPGDPDDRQPRYVEAAVRGVLVASLYAPNGNPQPGPKFDYKLAWMARLGARAADLVAAGVPAVLAGDFNVAPDPVDVYPTRSYDDNALVHTPAPAADNGIDTNRAAGASGQATSRMAPGVARPTGPAQRGDRSMIFRTASAFALAAALGAAGAIAQAQPIIPEKGKEASMVLLPKFLGILPFDQANQGAQEAHAELENPGELLYTGPTPENSVAGQIEIVTSATSQGQDVVMLSNNAGEQIAPAATAAQAAGTKIVTWDSPIASAEGESLFVAQVDFNDIGVVMADMAHSILGGTGQFAILSATPDAANQNAWIAAMKIALEGDEKYAGLELVDTVYGDDQSEVSYNRALALVDQHPDLGLIMAPTSVGIVAAAKAMQDEGLCDKVKVSGLGVPAEMVSYTMAGCAPEFALWSFVDLGYLTYYTSYLLATGQITGAEGESFEAGRMGTYTIEKDPTREKGLRVLMGPFTVYTAENVEAASK